MQSSVCDTMTDVLKSYLLALGKTTSTYCSHGKMMKSCHTRFPFCFYGFCIMRCALTIVLFLANRTQPNLSDLAQAFRNLGVDLSDLSEFICEVDSAPLEQVVPRFPIPRKSAHIYQGPSSYGETSKKRSRAPSLSSEDEEYDHIPPYLPPLPSQVIDAEKGILNYCI